VRVFPVNLLIIEDDKPVSAFLRQGFEAEEYNVDVAIDGQEGKSLVETRQYDLVILDLSLPHIDGADVLQHLRALGSSVPVLVLSGHNEIRLRVQTLDMGADDFVAKPFAFSELSARARALLRRAKQTTTPVLRVEDLELDRVRRQTRRSGREIDLTPKELALLEYLMENAGRCVSRAMIIENVWKLAPDTVSNVVDVYINYLRKKIDGESERRLIHSVRGAGYFIGLKPD
jgi:DNA-binding response OmpR family regulator